MTAEWRAWLRNFRWTRRHLCWPVCRVLGHRWEGYGLYRHGYIRQCKRCGMGELA